MTTPTNQLSPLARQVPGCRDPKLGHHRNPQGFLLHTTGGGITAKAKQLGKDPLTVALDWYRASQNGANKSANGKPYFWGGPTYLIDLAGNLHQLAPDDIRTEHCGHAHRDVYLSGAWKNLTSHAGVDAWQRQWPKYKSPQHLFPSRSPNDDYIGCEMIPIGDGFGGAPMGPGLRFSLAQHRTAVALRDDLGVRHGWPTGWEATWRLLGHEDVNPIDRDDAHGLWDPGFLRPRPYFDMAFVRTH